MINENAYLDFALAYSRFGNQSLFATLSLIKSEEAIVIRMEIKKNFIPASLTTILGLQVVTSECSTFLTHFYRVYFLPS